MRLSNHANQSQKPSEIHFPLLCPDVKVCYFSPPAKTMSNTFNHSPRLTIPRVIISNEMDPFQYGHQCCAALANIYVTLFVTRQCNDGRVSERHPFHSFPRIDEVLPWKH
jgi:hypothetical protein